MDEAPAQTRLSVRLTVSQMARVGEIKCLIIIICRRLCANLEKNDAIRVCEYLLSGQEQRGLLATGADWQCVEHSSQVVSVLHTRASVSRIWIQMVGQVSNGVRREREE